MTIARFLLGVPLTLLSVGSLALVAARTRRRFLPLWRGSDALLVDVTLALVALTVIGEALGTVGWFRAVPVLFACLLGSGVVWWVLDTSAHREGESATEVDSLPAASLASWSLVLAAGSMIMFAGSWIARSINAIADGITTVDSQWYHLPFAIRFFQTGRTTGVQLIDSDSVTAYFPASSSLLHAIGFLFFRIDLLSTVMNLGWLALALLAGWCIGKTFGVAPATMVGAAIVLGAPFMVETQPGGAYTDVVGIALMLAAAAIALRSNDRRSAAPDVIAALAAGLATGAKFTLLAPAGLLCLGLVATAPAGVRLRRSAVVFGASLLSGGYWYLRNFLIVGNPLPSIAVDVGPFHLPQVAGTLKSSTLASLVTHGDAWSAHLLPGLRDSLGPVWPAVLLLSFAGAALAMILGPEPRVRMIGVVAAVSNLAYLVTPQYLFGGIFFATNLRYAGPGLVLGLVLFPVALRRWKPWVMPIFAMVLIATQLDPVSWSTGFGGPSFFRSISRSSAIRGGLVTVVLAAAAATALLAWRKIPPARFKTPAVSLLVSLVALLGFAGVHGRYLETRYRGTPPFPATYQWVRGVHGANIGVFGQYVFLKSPFAAPDMSNRVQYLGVELDGGAWRPPTTCEEWVGLLAQGRYDYVIVLGSRTWPGPPTWTAQQPDARLVVREGTPDAEASVFRLDARRSPRTCISPSTPK